MDTVKYISDILSLNVKSGWSIFSENHPKDGAKLDLERWAWDWLNMYMYEFYFGEKIMYDNDQKDSIQFAIQIQSDTGYYDTNVEETEVDLFGSVDFAATRLLFIIGKNRWKDDDFHDLDILRRNGAKEYIKREADGVLGIKAYNLEDFLDEGGIHKCLADFVEFGESIGIKGFIQKF